MDILETISRLQRERQEKHIEPSHVPEPELMNEIRREARKELNRLFQEGRIGVVETLNGKAVFVKNKEEYVQAT